MGVSFAAVATASILMFLVGAIWYTFLFSKQWGKIHGFDKLDKKTQEKLKSQMGPIYLMQIVVTVFTAYVLAKLMALSPEYSPYKLALFVWAGLVLPAQVSSVLFGGTPQKYIFNKIAIMSAEALIHTLAAVWVIGLLQ